MRQSPATRHRRLREESPFSRTRAACVILLLLAGLLLLWPSIAAAGQPGPLFQAFVDRVNAALPGDRAAIVDSFLNAAPAFPFIEDTVAHFVYRGSASTVTVPGDANGWDPAGYPMTRLSTTDLWYRAETFEENARLDYKFVLNGGSWILDPRNPHQVSGGFGPNSELAMPAYVQPWEIQYRTAIPHGRLESKSLYSVIRALAYTVRIYLPPGYDASGLSYPTAYFHDGGDYLNLGSTVNILDNLIDSGRIAPIVAVFVTPTNRNEEYAGSVRTQYRLFFVNELVPYIDGLYRTKHSPGDRATIGDSYGGNISALISYDHPGVFGLCGFHSAALQPNGYEAYELIVGGPVKSDSLRFCSAWGSYEGSLTPNMRALTESLRTKGYEIPAMELHEGHSWGQWRATTDFILEHLFPASPVGVKEAEGIVSAFELEQNFPNPFNPSTTIRYRLARSSAVHIAVFNGLGQQVASLVDENQDAGIHELTFDGRALSSGTYLCRLRAGAVQETRKLLLVR